MTLYLIVKSINKDATVPKVVIYYQVSITDTVTNATLKQRVISGTRTVIHTQIGYILPDHQHKQG